MARYRRLTIGVYDNVKGLEVLPDGVGWAEYEATVFAGQMPDPMVPETVTVSVAELLAQANRLCEAKIDAGITFAGHDYQTDSASRLTLAERVATIGAGTPLPAGFTFRTTDNIDVVFVDADLVALLAAVNTRTSALREHSAILKLNIQNAEDPTLISITEGWPT